MIAAMLGLAASLTAAAPPARTLSFPNVPLVDQGQNRMRFAQDVIGGRIVVIGFTWTGCLTVCPITDQVMARAQALLAARLGPVRLLTITLDPGNDTPGRMAAKARQMGAGPNWLWLSGRYADVQQILDRLGASAGDLDAHPPRFLVVDGAAGRFVEHAGGTSAEQLAGSVAMLQARRTP